MDKYLAGKLDESSSQRHKARWCNTLEAFGIPVLGPVRADEIEVRDVLRTLEPIWTTKVTRWPALQLEDAAEWMADVRARWYHGKGARVSGTTRDKLAGRVMHVEVWCEAAGMLPQLECVAEPH